MIKKPAYAAFLKVNSIILVLCLSIELLALLTGIVFNFIHPQTKTVIGKNLFNLVLFTIFTFVLLYLNNIFKNKLDRNKK